MEEKGIIMKNNGASEQLLWTCFRCCAQVARKKPDAEERGLATVS